jgi:DNA-binding response OmpR family regulator
MKKVIVVEDEASIREVIGLILGTEFDLRFHATISSFASDIRKQDADLFLLDNMLPDGTGIQLCSHLKKDSLTAHIPVILMSAQINVSKIPHEADLFIAKPFDITDLIRAIRQFA